MKKILHSRQSGVSLIELLIGIALGVVVLTALALVFANSSRARGEIEKTSQQIENGRFATQQLMEELKLAGYYAEYNPTTATIPSALPDPCDVTSAGITAAIGLPVQGIRNAVSTSTTCLAAQNLRANSDVLVIRRASTCIAGGAGCAAQDVTKYFYLQKSLCQNNPNDVVVDIDATKFVLTKPDCTTLANIRSFVTRIYFVSDNNKAGDGIPTLKVADLGATGFSVTPLVTGIDSLRLEYGVFTSITTPPVYTTNPGTYNSCTGVDCQKNWANVTAVKVHVLARNNEASPGYSSTKTYILGADTFGPYADNYKRHAYTTVVRLNNIEGRLE